MSGLTNPNYTKHTYTHTQEIKESSSNPFGFGDIKVYVKQSPPI